MVYWLIHIVCACLYVWRMLWFTLTNQFYREAIPQLSTTSRLLGRAWPEFQLVSRTHRRIPMLSDRLNKDYIYIYIRTYSIKVKMKSVDEMNEFCLQKKSVYEIILMRWILTYMLKIFQLSHGLHINRMNKKISKLLFPLSLVLLALNAHV